MVGGEQGSLLARLGRIHNTATQLPFERMRQVYLRVPVVDMVVAIQEIPIAAARQQVHEAGGPGVAAAARGLSDGLNRLLGGTVNPEGRLAMSGLQEVADRAEVIGTAAARAEEALERVQAALGAAIVAAEEAQQYLDTAAAESQMVQGALGMYSRSMLVYVPGIGGDAGSPLR